MALKMMGALMVVAASFGLGYLAAARLRERLCLLEQMRRMTLLLKGEILYANSLLGEAFGAVGRKNRGPLAELFTAVSGRLSEQGGELFYEIWSDEVGKMDRRLPLNRVDKDGLLELGEHLGYLDREMQGRTILLYLERLETEISSLKGQWREKSRLYMSLGIMGGLFLVIVLV